jgi:hypothetical protein
MRIEPVPAISFTIHDAKALDPITVVMQDLAPGRGRLIVECFGSAWSAGWGAMAAPTTMDFVRGCSPDYLGDKLMPTTDRTPSKRERAYVHRIATALYFALRESSPSEGTQP